MKVAILLCVLATASFAMDPVAKHSAQVNAATQKLQAMPTFVTAAMTTLRSVKLQGVAEDLACQSAYQNFSAVWNSSCSMVGQVWSQNLTQSQLDNILQGYCTAVDPTTGQTCQQKVTSTFNQFLNLCKLAGAINATVFEEERFLLAASVVTCLQDDVDQHFCMNDFYALSHSNTSTLNATELATICSPCTAKVIAELIWWGNKDILQVGAYLGLICLKIDVDFCFPKFAAASVLMATMGATGFTQGNAAIWCDPCVEAFAFRYVATMEALGGDPVTIAEEVLFLAFHKFICVKNWQGAYCYPMIQANQANLSAMASTCLPQALLATPTCNDACHTAITTLKRTLGCCFGTWFNFLSFAYATNATFQAQIYPLTPATILTYVNTTCLTTVPRGCALQKLAVTLTFLGFDAVWVALNQLAVREAIQNYLLTLLSIGAENLVNLAITQGTQTVSGSALPNKVSLMQNQQTDQPVITTFEVYFDSDDSSQVQNTQENLNNASTQNPTGSSLAVLPCNARSAQNITSPPYVTAASVTVSPDGTARASSIVPFATLIIGLISLLIL